MKRVLLLLSAFVILSVIGINAQSVTGKWKTIDPETEKPSSVVEIYIENGKLYGKIVEVLGQDNPEKLICKDCPGKWKNNPIIGLTVLNGLKKDGDKWSGDDVLFSRKKKKTYDGAIWLEGDVLKVRVYVGWAYTTNEWHRAN